MGRRCVYCGADLPESLVETPPREATRARADRLVLVLDTSADAHALATALGRRSVDVGALQQRRRYLLHRILPVAEARSESERLASHGVCAVALSESAVREASQPLLATGGDPAKGIFTLEPGGETHTLGADDVLLVVWGPIRREPLSVDTRSMRALRRAPAPRVTERDLCHIHTKSSPRPLELDPSSFAFSETRGSVESGLLRLRAALAGLAAAVEIDRGFRWEAPALGVSSPPQRTSLADALPKGRGGAEGRKPATFLDNVAQFRFYSAWRGTLARHLANLARTPEPPL